MIAKQVSIENDIIKNDFFCESLDISMNNKIEIDYKEKNTKNIHSIKIKNKDKDNTVNKQLELEKEINKIQKETEITLTKNKNKNIDIYEPLTDKTKKTHNLRKIEYPDIYECYKTQEAAFWKLEEIDFTRDYENFIKLDKPVQKVIKMILAFFANSDALVNMNISQRIMDEIVPIEASITYQFQMTMENIHIQVYSLSLNVLIKDEEENEKLFNSIETINSIKLISDWALKWIDDDNISLPSRIVAFACMEGILFSGAFAFIFWLKEHSMGKICMEGLIKSNEFISRDEGLHKDFAVLLYKKFKNKPSNDTVISIIKESVDIGRVFVSETIEEDIVGLSCDDMNTYIEYVADRLSYSLIGKKIYNSENPFPFMQTIGMQQKTNFHESRVTEYKSALNSQNNSNNNLEMLDDF